MKNHRQARLLLRHAISGVLASHSLRHPGYPFGTALPCATDMQGRLLLLISHLAEHTKNVNSDGRVSFLIAPSGAQLQEQARITVVGDVRKIAREGPAQARYLRLHPDGAGYLDIGGFDFYCIEPRQARYIAGFGSMGWIEAADLLAPASALDDAEEDILAHMNEDHGAALKDYCRHVHQVQPAQVSMCGIDADGFHVLADDQLLRFDFERIVDSPGQAREELVKLAKTARQ
jgi:putative heme iron utilization protein